MTQVKNDTLAIYYASVIAKLPRKRKEQRFEVRCDGTPIDAVAKLRELIKTQGLRDVRAAQVQLWHGHETDFVDSNGLNQTMVFRNIFPSGSAVALEIRPLE